MEVLRSAGRRRVIPVQPLSPAAARLWLVQASETGRTLAPRCCWNVRLFCRAASSCASASRRRRLLVSVEGSTPAAVDRCSAWSRRSKPLFLGLGFI